MSDSSNKTELKLKPANHKLRWGLTLFFLLAEFGLIGYGIRGAIPASEVREVPGYAAWPPEVIETASEIPVQEGGRVKPLLTFARFQMLTFHGAVTMKVESGGTVHKIGPVEWLLDCLFRPELADQLPIFRIDDSDILRPFGIEAEDRRARLSFNDLMEGGKDGEDGFTLLIDRGRELLEKQEEKGEDSLTPREKKTVQFAQKALNYTGIRDSLAIVRGGLDPVEPQQLAYVDGQLYNMLSTKLDPEKFSFWMPMLRETLQSLERLDSREAQVFNFQLRRQMHFAKFGPVWIPPQTDEDEEWQSLGKKVEKFLAGGLNDNVELLKDLQALESLAASAARPNSDEFLTKLEDWRERVEKRAETRGEGEKIATEVTYYERNYFMYGLAFFLIAFLISAVGWMVRTGRPGLVIALATTGFYCVGGAYVVAGIIHRYLITGRPPVSNLYDTIPFITAGAVILLGIAELLTRRRILMSIGAALAVIGLFFAFRFEMGDAKDNMDPLRAVLDSNYWLATHVVTITIGYCGGLVACFLSLVYVHLALAGVMKDPKGFHRFMTRAVYGITCFTLLFALVGTVLGGIWANDSWGRFWGWDPKENGALLIVLWSLIILHSRLAGWMTGWGIHLMSILGGSVVVFSWWGVNMLGVGLHSYGFTEGAEAVYYFYGTTVLAFVVGLVARAVDRSSPRRKKKEAEVSGKLVSQS